MTGGRWRGTTFALACIGAVVAVSACSGSPDSAPTSPSPAAAIAMMPNANPFTSALAFTYGLGTAHAVVDSTTTVAGRTTERTVTGTIALDPGGYGIVTMSADGSAVEEMGNTKDLFLRPNGTGLWTQRPGAVRSDASWLITPLTGLGDLTGLVEEGPEELDGSDADRYTGQLPATTDRLRALGLDDSALATVGDAWQDAPIDVAIWVDARNRIVRVDRSFAVDAAGTPALSARTSTRLSAFTAPLDLSGPPSQSIAATLPSASATSS